MMLGTLAATDNGNGTCTIERNGLFGPRTMILPVSSGSVAEWIAGRCLVQEAFPHLSPDQCEFLLTGCAPGDFPFEDDEL